MAQAALPQCAICMEDMGKYGGPCSLPCGHNGCLQCMAHVQRSKAQPLCPICRSPFPQNMPLVVNYELRDLMQLATALTTVDRDEGWQAVTSAKMCGKGAVMDDKYDCGGERGAVALLPSAPPLHVDLRAVLEGAGDLMSLEPPKWAADSSTAACRGCHRPFSFLVRSRHHCRVCGDLFCDTCTSGRMLLPPRFLQTEPQRVCAPCGDLLQPLQPLLAGTVSKAVQAPVHDTTDWSVWRSLLNSPISQRLEDDIFKSVNIVRSFSSVGAMKPERGIPAAVLSGCAGLAILSVLKVGAGWSCGLGTGLVVARRADGSWSAPSSVLSMSAGAGWQVGAALTDVIVVLRNAAAVRAFCGSQLGVGGTVSIAAGPLGREAAAKLQLGTSGGAVCYSYSCSRGAYMGLGLEGSVIRCRDACNRMFYGRSLAAKSLLLSEACQPPAAAAALYDALDELLGRVGELGAGRQFTVRVDAREEEEEEQWGREGAEPRGRRASHSSGAMPLAIPASPPRRGRERGRERAAPAAAAAAGGGGAYHDVHGAAPLWHAQSAPTYSSWEDGQSLPSLFD